MHSCIPRLAKPLEHLLQSQCLWHLALILEGYKGSLTQIEVSLWGQSPPVTYLHQQLGVKLEVTRHFKFLFLHRGLQERQSLCHCMCTGYHTGQVAEDSDYCTGNEEIQRDKQLTWNRISRSQDVMVTGTVFPLFSRAECLIDLATESDREDADGAEESFARGWKRQCIAFTYIGSFLKIYIDWASRYKLFPSTKLSFWARWQQEREV